MAVFVSHSKHDVELKKYFSQIFAHIGLKAKFMEWENLDNKYAGKEISDIIRGSWFGENVSAVIVLLSSNLTNPPSAFPQYTHNWVNFEVGVSAGVRKPVWVFEDFREFIQFPIPYVTDYCQYTLNSDSDIKFIGEILEDRFVKFTNGRRARCSVRCPNPNCNAEYFYWSSSDLIQCPVCRQGIKFN